MMRRPPRALLVLAATLVAPAAAAGGGHSVAIASQAMYWPGLLLACWAARHHGLSPLTPKRLFFVFMVLFFALRVAFFSFMQQHEEDIGRPHRPDVCWNFVNTNPNCPRLIALDVAGFACSFIDIVIVLWCFLLRSTMPRGTRRRLTFVFFFGCFSYVTGLMLILLVPHLLASRLNDDDDGGDATGETRYINVYVGCFALLVEVMFFVRGVNVVLRLRRIARGRRQGGDRGRLLRTYRLAATAICVAAAVYTARCVFVISRWDSWSDPAIHR